MYIMGSSRTLSWNDFNYMAEHTNNDVSNTLQTQVLEAVESKTALKIQGGNSKHFYGRAIEAQLLDVSQHQGIINYEPTELVITARAGTRLQEIEAALNEHRQTLAFEPPKYADSATLGGTFACNFSGPRRAYRGSARDNLLGSKIINGKGEILSFGGEVMKNVAGYDASRLMCGAMGTLGVMLEASIKVIPKAETEITLVHTCSAQQALDKMHQWALSSLPLSGSCYDGKNLYIRLSSNEAAVTSASKIIGGERLEDKTFWYQLKEQQLPFFNTDKPLWRLSISSNTAPLHLEGETLYEWGGALRWLSSDEPVEKIRHAAQDAGGHATLLYNTNPQIEPFHELGPGLFSIHRNLKQAFDPLNILNPARMYANL